MNSQQFANVIVTLIEKVSVPASQANVVSLTAVYEILGALAQGELILAKSVPVEAPKD